MAAASNAARKRFREEDVADFLLSPKRAKPFSLNNNYTAEPLFDSNSGNQFEDSHSMGASFEGQHSAMNDNIRLPQQHKQHQQVPQLVMCCNGSTTINRINNDNYNPELSADQNPYYYSTNKLLYDLHGERMRRCCGPLFH